MKKRVLVAMCATLVGTNVRAQDSASSANALAAPAAPSSSAAIVAPPAASRVAAPATSRVLPAGTPVLVMMNDEVSTQSSVVGNVFGVTVLEDVVHEGTIVIPKGTTGFGEVTFRTGKGGFGKPGIIAIGLRQLDLNGKQVSLDGRYREEGGNNNGAAFATWFAVGIFAGVVQGKSGVIPKGRELKARTGEDIAFGPAAAPAPATTPTASSN
jgi:hypothetical protein